MDRHVKITSSKRFHLKDLLEIFLYKDLLYYLFKREVVATYKQSIFGFLWFIAQPLSLTFIYYFIFTEVAELEIANIHPALFYLSGVVVWTAFQEIYNLTSSTLIDNSYLFSKVYFPRLIAPVASMGTVLLKSLIQIIGILVFCLYAFKFLGEDISINPLALFFSFFTMILLSLGLGLLVASLSIKYKDVKFMLSYVVNLLMYVTPVMYSRDALDQEYLTLINYNPLTSILECFRSGLVAHYNIDFDSLIRAVLICFITFCLGVFVFSWVEKDSMDKV